MDLYYSRISGNSSRAMLALEELGVAYEPRLVDPRKGETRSASYLAINPMGKVPAFVDGNVMLWESNAISWYIAEKYPEAGLLPGTIAGRASVQRWLFFQAAHVSPACRAIFRNNHPTVRAFWNAPQNPQEATGGERELARYLPVLEAVLAPRSFLEGEPTLADLAYVPHFTTVEETGFQFSAYPAVAAWLKRLQARPAWERTYQRIFAS
jgi:glutathione S-transferase